MAFRYVLLDENRRSLCLCQGKIVTHVNGKPAGEHLQARADAAASMRDAGARLNFLLGHHAAEVLDIYPPPPLDEEVFTFADGSQATWKLTVMQMGADDPLVSQGMTSCTRYPFKSPPI